MVNTFLKKKNTTNHSILFAVEFNIRWFYLGTVMKKHDNESQKMIILTYDS